MCTNFLTYRRCTLMLSWSALSLVKSLSVFSHIPLLLHLYSFRVESQSISKRQGPVLKGQKNDMEVVLKLKASSSYSGATCFVLFCFCLRRHSTLHNWRFMSQARWTRHSRANSEARGGEKNKQLAPSALLCTIWTPGTLRLFWPH